MLEFFRNKMFAKLGKLGNFGHIWLFYGLQLEKYQLQSSNISYYWQNIPTVENIRSINTSLPD